MSTRNILIVLALVFNCTLASAQRETVTLSSDMFETHQRILLAPLDGWVFQQGHDPAWAKEYLKLSYHGLRANLGSSQGQEEKSFNADFKTNFDPNLPKMNVVPQDIGRVLLNLINNAFQTCAQAGVENPLVSIKTQRTTSDEIRISITDNGPGIPDNIKDKIFQPFFTTKPTGQGAGLGLSYDIVKAHGGDLSMKSSPDGQTGTVFTIQLPL
ncbi:MAG: signal transduction histidine kinase [Cryomorphaceae bacterium]|jgi:signal transduction histidine kinase